METELRLRFGLQGARTVAKKRYCSNPLKLGLPYNREERFHVITMMASAGMLKGDRFSYEILCEEGTKARMTEQSYTKIFDTQDGEVCRRQHITVQNHASFFYEPAAVIPFGGSRYRGNMQVQLKADSEFLYQDILAVGRVAMGEKLLFSMYQNRVLVEVEQIPVWMEHCLLLPEKMPLEQMVFLDGYTHQGTLYYYGSSENILWEALQHSDKKMEKKRIWVGVTRAQKGICVRVLAMSAQETEEFFDELKQNIQ